MGGETPPVYSMIWSDLPEAPILKVYVSGTRAMLLRNQFFGVGFGFQKQSRPKNIGKSTISLGFPQLPSPSNKRTIWRQYIRIGSNTPG